MAITTGDVTEFLSTYGITLPSIMIDSITAKVNTAEQCMINAGYDCHDITMALLFASALIGVSMASRKVASQSADVVSQSFKHESLEDLTNRIEDNLVMVDPMGCTNSVIPNTGGAYAFVTTGGGSCCG